MAASPGVLPFFQPEPPAGSGGPVANPHDTGYKLLFSSPELVRDLILGFVPDEWLHGLDYSTLERVPGSYVTEDFSNR